MVCSGLCVNLGVLFQLSAGSGGINGKLAHLNAIARGCPCALKHDVAHIFVVHQRQDSVFPGVDAVGMVDGCRHVPCNIVGGSLDGVVCRRGSLKAEAHHLQVVALAQVEGDVDSVVLIALVGMQYALAPVLVAVESIGDGACRGFGIIVYHLLGTCLVGSLVAHNGHGVRHHAVDGCRDGHLALLRGSERVAVERSGAQRTDTICRCVGFYNYTILVVCGSA